MRTYTNTYTYVCKRKTTKKRELNFFALNIKVIDEEEKAMILMFCFVFVFVNHSLLQLTKSRTGN